MYRQTQHVWFQMHCINNTHGHFLYLKHLLYVWVHCKQSLPKVQYKLGEKATMDFLTCANSEIESDNVYIRRYLPPEKSKFPWH